MSRTGISHAEYGRGVKLKQNRQPFWTEDDIEARSDDSYECNIPVRAFLGWSQHRGTGFDAHSSFTFPLPLGAQYNREPPHKKERSLAGDMEKRAGLFTVLPKFHDPTTSSHLSSRFG